MTFNQFIGIGLRHEHYNQVVEEKPPVNWFEVHSENFFLNKGPAQRLLQKIRENHAISLHGVGLSLGSSQLSQKHLDRLKNLIEVVNPLFVSEHLSWSNIGDIALPDLLPIPYTRESYNVFSQNIETTQDFLKREILIENPSSYFEYKNAEFAEAEFLVSLCKDTGAKILLDINNVFVSCTNHGWNAKKYITSIPKKLVKQIHLAGHSQKVINEEKTLLVDTHDNFVSDEVWALYQIAIDHFGPIPTLLEWDTKIPPLEVLMQESQKALTYLPRVKPQHAQA